VLGGISVVTTENVRVGLQEEPNVGVPNPLADHFRAHAGLERTGGNGGTVVHFRTLQTSDVIRSQGPR
jgi:hypothetical protein